MSLDCSNCDQEEDKTKRRHSLIERKENVASLNSNLDREENRNDTRASSSFSLHCAHGCDNKRVNTVPILVFNSWPNPKLSHCIEDDDDDDYHLHSKLQCATCSVTCIQQRMRHLRHDYEELEDSTSNLIAEAQHLVADLRDVRNLEILLQLQNGNLENLPLQNPPFTAMTQEPSSKKTNLIV
ncbi:uncharacterized protein LOC111060183 [Nilaparvata lugens]|uniref:uncharacterized protein LOC111060183 n=1 Tax=Nilaparvata lugens TaxID=108931 RepID=UPI00193E4ED4|nr:uncharacterized protein LOC111060183 [Nilaparvata lugens]